ncbi:hypothetical protein AJ80_05961 [Polytolypa hystricis UAMH7299]|uniref:Uncharacterized protein n=1 Tax=Polytolypa hystricis (strain UAMH7299) TaxID=1447883 RepID=A0A2B7Y024_POLH7|nr:hypothetical protein AJ80_05961 [Polytolypa hystricis UAMH7299]
MEARPTPYHITAPATCPSYIAIANPEIPRLLCFLSSTQDQGQLSSGRSRYSGGGGGGGGGGGKQPRRPRKESHSLPLLRIDSTRMPPEPPQWENVVGKGKALHNAQVDAQDRGDPDAIFPKLEQMYDVERSQKQPREISGTNGLEPLLERTGMRMSDTLQFRMIWRQGAPKTDTSTTLRMGMNTEHNTVIRTWAYRRHDSTRTQLGTSELVWQEWKKQAGDHARDLKFLIDGPITNDVSQRIIRYANWKKTQREVGQMVTFTRSETNKDEKSAFDALMGSDNGRYVLRMLRDHRKELGNMEVVSVTTWAQREHSNVFLLMEIGEVGDMGE